MSLIEFKGIKKNFGDKEVLKNVSFSVKKGEIFGFLGVSGSGKSTILNVLMGLVRQDMGEIFFQGKNVTEKPLELRKGTGFATQSNTIFDELTIRENALYFGSLYGVKKKTMISKKILLPL